jgi:transposase
MILLPLRRRPVSFGSKGPVFWTEDGPRNICRASDLEAEFCKSLIEICGVKTVALQLTGVYWIRLYDILEEREFEVYLVNARHTKNLPGRKSDVQESQWPLKLHT